METLEGERHPKSSPEALEEAAGYIHECLDWSGLEPRYDPFTFRGATYKNVVAEVEGEDPDAARVLVGAHYDTVRGTPGADDNASGVAVLLEAARILAAERHRGPVELVAFNLEEQQGRTYRVGSRQYAARAREWGVDYAGALVLEMVGYRSTAEKSQRLPALISWRRDIPRTGDFLAVTADGQSSPLLERFREAAEEAAPELPLVTFRSPFRGWLVWQTRLSDNASFWSEGYRSLMITDTAFLRNPNYHGPGDRADTLDYEFMARVADATVETARRLAETP